VTLCRILKRPWIWTPNQLGSTRPLIKSTKNESPPKRNHFLAAESFLWILPVERKTKSRNREIMVPSSPVQTTTTARLLPPNPEEADPKHPPKNRPRNKPPRIKTDHPKAYSMMTMKSPMPTTVAIFPRMVLPHSQWIPNHTCPPEIGVWNSFDFVRVSPSLPLWDYWQPKVRPKVFQRCFYLGCTDIGLTY